MRNTVVTVIGLPVIMIGTFAVMSALGLTLNIVTLLALSLAVGLVIDDAIVVRENIFRHMERGEDPKTAALNGTNEVGLAVLAMTLTVVSVFLPIAFVGGLIGKFFSPFGLAVTAAVLISLFEAFTLAPMLSAYWFRQRKPSPGTGGTCGGRRRAARLAGPALSPRARLDALAQAHNGRTGWAGLSRDPGVRSLSCSSAFSPARDRIPLRSGYNSRRGRR